MTAFCTCRYMADEARNLKAYGELPENSESASIGYLPDGWSCQSRAVHRQLVSLLWLYDVCVCTVLRLILSPVRVPLLPCVSSTCAPLAGCCKVPILAAVRVNETDTFADEEGLNDEYFDFEDISGGPCCVHAFEHAWPSLPQLGPMTFQACVLCCLMCILILSYPFAAEI